MQIWRSWHHTGLDPDEQRIVTIGNFDGVHRGHRHVIDAARDTAARLAVDRVVAVTFDPHPMAVLRPEHAPVMLSDVHDRIDLLAEAGVDDILVLEFSREMAAWTPQEFVDRVIVGALHARGVVVGSNFRFGARAAGDLAFLREVGKLGGFETVGVELDGGPQVWSSTYIRTCLAAGDVEGAAQALGRPVTVSGAVQRGDQRGRELGYPTANVAIGAVAAPADGVYAGWLEHAGERLPAAISVGTNPTFDGQRIRRVEAYVLDRTDLALYDAHVRVEFVAHLRGMAAFASVEELLAAMAGDVEAARAELS